MTRKRKLRFLTILKYSFFIIMTCLAIINIAFFICNWYDLELQLSQESLMLTVVGFFFAFAGINIYSIFNTNIEFEKQSLRDLESRYEERLKLSEKELQFPRELIRTYHTAQYLVSAQSLNINSYDWIRTIKHNLVEMRDFVTKFKENGNEDKFEMYRTDLKDLSQGILVLLRNHEVVVGREAFFKNKLDEQNNYKNKLSDLISFVDALRTYTYEPQIEIGGDMKFFGKVRKIVSYARKMFKKP